MALSILEKLRQSALSPGPGDTARPPGPEFGGGPTRRPDGGLGGYTLPINPPGGVDSTSTRPPIMPGGVPGPTPAPGGGGLGGGGYPPPDPPPGTGGGYSPPPPGPWGLGFGGPPAPPPPPPVPPPVPPPPGPPPAPGGGSEGYSPWNISWWRLPPEVRQAQYEQWAARDPANRTPSALEYEANRLRLDGYSGGTSQRY